MRARSKRIKPKPNRGYFVKYGEMAGVRKSSRSAIWDALNNCRPAFSHRTGDHARRAVTGRPGPARSIAASREAVIDDPLDRMIQAERNALALARLHEELGPRDAHIIECRMHGMTLQAIGHCYGLTRQRIEQIVRKAAPIVLEEME